MTFSQYFNKEEQNTIPKNKEKNENAATIFSDSVCFVLLGSKQL